MNSHAKRTVTVSGINQGVQDWLHTQHLCDTVTLPCQSPAAGPVWPLPGLAFAPSAPRSPAPGDSSSFPRCPAGCGDGWTHLSPPERVKKEEQRMNGLAQGVVIQKHHIYSIKAPFSLFRQHIQYAELLPH